MRSVTVREPSVTTTVGFRYQITAKKTEKAFIYAVGTLIFGMCNSVRLSLLFVVTFCKCSINRITSPNPVSSHSKV
jgi:hypothetical protein